MKINPFRVLWVVLALLLALAFTQPVFALGARAQADTSLTIPAVLIAAFSGWVTFMVTEGLKKYFPMLAGLAAQIASIIVAAVVTYLSGLLAGVTSHVAILAIQAVFYFLVAWVTSQGIFLTKKKDRIAAAQGVKQTKIV